MRVLVFLLSLLLPLTVFASGNERIFSFSEAKYILLHKIYYDYNYTVYCDAQFDKNNINLPEGFTTPSYHNRKNKLEWEHIVPAQHFGATIPEWYEGHKICFDGRKHKYFRGRKCARLTSDEFRRMEADLYNLYPSIGSVNALRQNYPFTEFPDFIKPSFGICPMKIHNNLAEPPKEARGTIARTFLYMEDSYSEYYQMDKETKDLMLKWNDEYPVTEWECERARRIERIQGNKNIFVDRLCNR